MANKSRSIDATVVNALYGFSVLVFSFLVAIIILQGAFGIGSFSNDIVDQKLQKVYGEKLRSYGIERVDAPSIFVNDTASVGYHVNGKKYTATIHYNWHSAVPACWITIDNKGVHYRGNDDRSKTGNMTEFDYHFRKGSGLIADAITAVRETEANRKRWEK